MAKRTAKNLDDLFKIIGEEVKDSMEDVAQVAKIYQSEAVQSDIYDTYTAQEPYMERRGYSGGLADKDNMPHTISSGIEQIELFVDNHTRGNPDVYQSGSTYAPDYLSGIIVRGRDRGRYMTNRTNTADVYLNGRNFFRTAVNNMQRDLAHIEELKRSLKQKGIQTD